MSTFNLNDLKLTNSLHLPRFVESPLATEEAQDWSKVRSPARAKRRLKRGFKQKIRFYRKPACFFIKADNTYYIHPELMKELRKRTSEMADDYFTKSFSSVFR